MNPVRRWWLAAAALFAVAASAQAAIVGWVGVPLEGGVTVPNVVGEANSAAADVILEAVGLDLGTVSEQCSAEPDDEVLAQNPLSGANALLGSLVDINVSNGVACSYDLTGIPAGWRSIPNVLADRDFVALMRIEATTGGGNWAYWLPGAIQNSANLQLNMAIIRIEATSGGANWARWAPGTQPGNTGNLQMDMRAALNADFL